MAKRSRSSKKSASRNLGAQLELLENTQLIRHLVEEEPAYIFRHTLTQESAYDSLLKNQRHAIHRAVAQAYEEIYANRCADEFAAILARHYAQTNEDAKTLDYATRGGDIAARIYASDEAFKSYTLALDAAKRSNASTPQFIDLYTKRGRALEVRGRFADSIINYEEMAALAQTRHDRALELASLILRATVHSAPTVTFDANLGQQLSDDALTVARELGDQAAEARTLWNLSLLNFYTSHPMQAITYGEQALAIAREMNENGQDMREQVAYILHDLVLPVFVSGQGERAETITLEARALWTELDNKPMLADSLSMSGRRAMMSAEYRRGVEFTGEGAALAESIGNWFGVSSNRWVQSIIYIELGEFSSALRLGDELIRQTETLSGLNQAIPSAQQAWLLGTLGAFEKAGEIENRARRALPLPMPGHFRAGAYASLARLNILRGNLLGAEADLAAGYDDPARLEQLYSAAEMLIAKAELGLVQGDAQGVVGIIDGYISEARQREFRKFAPEILYLYGRAFAQQGKVEKALELMREASTVAKEINARRIGWQILAAMSDLERQRGNPDEAETLRSQARETVEYISLHTPPDLRASFLNLPEVRAITTFEANDGN